ncbi:DUF1905 domain-containing protein [Nonomuraea sp. NPDC003709]|uniref:DUF1905 domain-containing protein n=1 Tax=Nonomuraea sp. NPDC003709 TaxID=3154450 RepID=UPI0033AEA881
MVDDKRTTTREIDVTFTASIVADSNSGWPCVQMSGSADFFGTGKAVKVAGTVDGHAYEATMLPIGGGTHMMPLRAPFRKIIGKDLGDEVTVHLRRRFS